MSATDDTGAAQALRAYRASLALGRAQRALARAQREYDDASAEVERWRVTHAAKQAARNGGDK